MLLLPHFCAKQRWFSQIAPQTDCFVIAQANVEGGEEIASPKPAPGPKTPAVSLPQLEIPAETLTPCAEAIQLLSQGSKEGLGADDDALVNTGSPACRHVSDVSPIMGLVEIPVQPVELSQGFTAQADNLSDLLKVSLPSRLCLFLQR